MRTSLCFQNLLDEACCKAEITRVADVTQMDCLGVPVCQAIRPKSKNYVVSQGKGSNIQSARISAIMESLEFFHGEKIQVELDDCYLNVKSHLQYDIHDLPVTSNFDLKVNEKIPWVEVFNIAKDNNSFLPWELISLDFTKQRDNPMFRTTSNGFCGGVDDESALTHGYLEVMERHILSTGIKTRIKIDSSICDIMSPNILNLVRRGFKLAVNAYKSELKLPTFMVTILGPDDGLAFSGTCSDVNFEAALRKAYFEAAQSRLTHITGSRDDLTNFSYKVKSEFLPKREIDKSFITIKDYVGSSCVSHNVKKHHINGLLIDTITRSGYKSIFIKNISLKELVIPFYVVSIPGMKFNKKHLL